MRQQPSCFFSRTDERFCEIRYRKEPSGQGFTNRGVVRLVSDGYPARMTESGQTGGIRVDETGTLVRDGGAFYLRRDSGGRYELRLQRTPIDLVEKRVRLVGTLIGDDRVDADGVAPA